MLKKIVIKGAKEHNLKNISLEIPKDQFVVITGVSGSGKSSLAFDTVYAEGQRRYVESLSAYARQFLDKMKKPNVDLIEGLSPAISIEQKNTSKNPRSTVATVTEIYDYMRVLFSRAGTPYSPFTGKPINLPSSFNNSKSPLGKLTHSTIPPTKSDTALYCGSFFLSSMITNSFASIDNVPCGSFTVFIIILSCLYVGYYTIHFYCQPFQ